MKRILFTQDDGVLAIIVPAPAHSFLDIVDIANMTVKKQGFYEWIAEKDVPKMPDGSARPYEIVDTAIVPSDRHFRDAWEHHPTEKVKVNMTKAVEVQRNKIRAERAPLLADLDVQYMQALETKDVAKQSAIIAEKQRLRDITKLPDLAAAATPDDLKAITCETGKTKIK